MAQATIPVPIHPKHDIHKFQDIKPKLMRDNWTSWKREMLAMAMDRGLYATINATDELPDATNQTITVAVAGDPWSETSLYCNYKKSGAAETTQSTVKFFYVSLLNFRHQLITWINVQKFGPYSCENLNLTIPVSGTHLRSTSTPRPFLFCLSFVP